MANVWKHPNSKFWYARFADETGRWVNRSTKQVKKGDAMQVALEWERAARLGRDKELTEVQSRRILSGILERTVGDSIRQVPTRLFLENWLAGKQMAKSSGTHTRYQTTVEQFMASLGDKADRPISAITAADIQSFINLRVGAGLATKTVVVDVKSLNNAFNRARRQGLIENNPVEAVDLPTVESSTRKPFTVAEAKWIFDAAPDKDWSTAIALGYYLGARLGDCVNMKWDNVNFNDGVIVYGQKKVNTGRSKTVVTPLHTQLERYLMTLASTDQPEEFLCPSLANKTSGGSKGLSAQFREIMLQANVDPETVPGMGRRKFSRKSFHSFRHTLPTSLEREGVPEAVHMKLSGHASRDVHSLYTHTELATFKAAIEKLPELELGN